MSESSTDLWRRWRSARDDHAFAALVVPEIPRAVAVARGAGCERNAAEDAVQEALLGLAQEPSDAPIELGLRVWLFREVRDRARSSLRSSRRRRRREESSARPEATDGPGSRAETAEVVERALERLDPEDREAVRLRYSLDLEYGEVAAVLRTTPGAARVRVHRALERLRARLGGDAATLLAALPLPLVARPEAFVASALAEAVAATAAATAGAGAAVTGGAVMASGKAMVAAGVVAFAAGAAVSWTAVHTSEPQAPETGVVEPSGGTAAPVRGPTKRAARPVEGTAPDRGADVAPAPSSSLEDLKLTDAERVWVRDALVAERKRREESVIRPGDAGTDILDRWLKSGADLEPVLASFDAAAAHVRAATGTPTRIEGTGPITAANPPADATVLEFGPGRFTLGPEWRNWSSRRTDVEAIEIRGAGADQTVIVANDDLLHCWDAATLKHVRIRGVTIESVENLIDARGSVSVALEGVRVVGWQSGGHSSPIGVSGRAFLACRDCEFVGGEGIGVASLRGPGAVVFEKCTFVDVKAVVLGGGAASGGRPSVVRFVDCRFEDSRVADSRIRQGKDAEVDLRVRGGSVALLGAKATEDERKRAWGAEHAAEVSGVTFGPATPRFTVADALRALEFASAAGIRDIVGFDVASAPRGAAPTVNLYFLDAKGTIARTTRRLLPAGLGEPEDSRSGMRGFGPITPAQLSAALPLAELIRRAEFANDEALTGAQYTVGSVLTAADAAPRTALFVQFESGDRRQSMLDAQTGAAPTR